MGKSATAFGIESTALASYSTSWGFRTKATGTNSTVWGAASEASEPNSTAWGSSTLAGGTNSTAWGSGTIASGFYSTAWGLDTDAIGISSTAWGSGTIASGFYSTAWGTNIQADAYLQTSLGRWNVLSTADGTNWFPDQDLFVIGNGSNDSDRNNAFTVKKNGKIGINNASPSYVLDVESNISDNLRLKSTSSDFDIILDGASGNNAIEFNENGSFKASFGWDSSNERLFFYQGGANVLFVEGAKLGIKKTAPAYDLHLNNNSAAKPTSSAWTVASDRRLKTNVKPFTNGIETLMQINPVWFTYNGLAGMPKETGVGTIAQELERIAPFMVDEWDYKTESGEIVKYKAVDYGAIDFILINAIQEQQKEIELLKEVIMQQQIIADQQQAMIEQFLGAQHN